MNDYQIPGELARCTEALNGKRAVLCADGAMRQDYTLREYISKLQMRYAAIPKKYRELMESGSEVGEALKSMQEMKNPSTIKPMPIDKRAMR